MRRATGEQLMIAVGGNINYRSDTSQAPPRVFNLARLTTFKFDALKLAHGTGLPWIRMPIRKVQLASILKKSYLCVSNSEAHK